MNCAFDKEKLTGYFDGELGAAEKAEVERHIASCSECLRDLGDLKSAALLVKELPRLRAPASIAAGVSKEIQAAGKLHVLARFRRTVLWASAAAAGLFIVMNVMYFSAPRREAPMAAKSPSLVAPIANTEVAKQEPRKDAESAAKAAPGANAAPRPAEEGLRQQEVARRELLERKTAAPATPAQEDQKLAGADALKKADDRADKSKEKSDPEAPKAAPSPAPAPTTAAPPKPSAPATPMLEKGESAKPFAAQAEKEKDIQKVNPEFLPKVDPSARAKSAAAEASPELPAIHCTLSTTQLATARPRMEEALKRMGVALPPPPPAMKGPRPLPDNVLTIEISDSQLAALREELEKPGDARLTQSSPVEPVLPQFRGGGLYAKKEPQTGATAASGGKAKAEGKDAAAADAPAEPRRKVTLHLVEVKTLPADAEDRPLKK